MSILQHNYWPQLQQSRGAALEEAQRLALEQEMRRIESRNEMNTKQMTHELHQARQRRQDLLLLTEV